MRFPKAKSFRGQYGQHSFHSSINQSTNVALPRTDTRATLVSTHLLGRIWPQKKHHRFCNITMSERPCDSHYRALGGVQSAFKITAVPVGSFRSCEMNDSVPHGGSPIRGVI
jgi:hypothetical protein